MRKGFLLSSTGKGANAARIPEKENDFLNYKPEDKKAFSQVDFQVKTEDVKASSQEPTSMIVVDTRDGVVICKIGSWTTFKIHRQNEDGVWLTRFTDEEDFSVKPFGPAPCCMF